MLWIQRNVQMLNGTKTLKNLPEEWRRWKRLHASESASGETEGMELQGSNGSKWYCKSGSFSTRTRRSSHSKSLEKYSAASPIQFFEIEASKSSNSPPNVQREENRANSERLKLESRSNLFYSFFLFLFFF